MTERGRYRGRHLPLTQNDPYNGPVLGYLLAAAFWLVGVRVELPRLVMLLLGSLTVISTYALARVGSLKFEVGSWKFNS